MELTNLSSELALAKKAAEVSGQLLQDKKKQFNEVLSSNSKDIKLKADTESEGLIKGAIQVPADGNPIIMLSDHGTIGGYPKIAIVISADYDKLVQFQPGSNIKFESVNLKEAENLNKLYNLETHSLLNSI